ncbi:hypothetical protein F2P81_017469 [Scophthalmus maximus]|uniref:Uncharacterized protein n=1 Tax=Scophthalmus maximus TaxID=52904 RepID=A0A6A4SET1_SCOMX|nr:hypothetical protein F2P81_017469 [Scophthalmus maximus]
MVSVGQRFDAEPASPASPAAARSRHFVLSRLPSTVCLHRAKTEVDCDPITTRESRGCVDETRCCRNLRARLFEPPDRP